MKRSFRKRNFICENPAKMKPPKSTYPKRWKMPVSQRFCGYRRMGNSDKESSHVVGISSGKGDSR